MEGYGQEYPLDPERYAVIDSCMAYMSSDPALAHHMLDSVRDLSIISPQRCDFLHAMVVSEGEGQCDSALMICYRLLEEHRFGDDQFLEAEVCELVTNINSGLGRYVEVLQYAQRGIALCHGKELMRSDEASMMGRAGVAYQQLGQYDEAKETYLRALELIADDSSFGGLNAQISLLKKQSALYHEMGDYHQVIAVGQEILSLVGRFDHDPSFVNPRPATMTESGEATRGFAQFYQSQVYLRIANAYRMMVEQQLTPDPSVCRDSASAYVEQWMRLGMSGLPKNNLPSALPELYFTGHMAAFDEARQLAGQSFGSDTLVTEYVDYLTLLAQVSASRHEVAQSNGYLQRALAVSDSIRRSDMIRSFAEQASVHMVKEAQLAQKDAEYQLARNHLYLVLLVAALLTLVLVEVIIWRNRHHQKVIKTVQQDLQESKLEIQDLEQQLEDVKAERSMNSPKELYQRIEQVMKEKELYLDQDFDLKALAREVGAGITNVSVSINGITGMSFRVWLSKYRLSMFVKMLEQHPDQSIDDLMFRSGYREQSTFRRHFKAAYGVTVTEYRQKVLRDKQR